MVDTFRRFLNKLRTGRLVLPRVDRRRSANRRHVGRVESLEQRTVLAATLSNFLTTEHVDLNIGYSGGTWSLSPRDSDAFPAVNYAADDALLYAGTGSQQSRPAGAEFNFIGVNAGDSYYRLPASQDPSLLYLGFAGYGVSSGDIDRYVPTAESKGRVTSSGHWIRASLVSVTHTLPDGTPGTGKFSMWQNDVGGPVVLMSSHDDGVANPDANGLDVTDGISGDDSLWIIAGGHLHYNFAFTQPGRYEVEYRLSAYFGSDGNDTTANVAGFQQSAPLKVYYSVASVGQVGFVASTASVNEDAGTAVVNVTRTGGSDGRVRVDYATQSGTAIAGTEFTSTSGTLVFNDGETTKQFTVPIINNLLDQPNKSFNVVLSSPGPSSIQNYYVDNQADANGLLSTISTLAIEIVDDEEPPTISAIADLNTNEDTPTSAIGFIVGDGQTPAANLVVMATSSNPAVVAPAGITLGGSGANRTITLSPVQHAFGTTTITVTVTDGSGLTASEVFDLVVNPVNDDPTISAIGNQSTAEDTATGSIAFSIADIESAAGVLVVTATSSNQTLVPDANITLGGTGNDRTVVITPAANQTGLTTITLTVMDPNGGTAQRQFTLNVTPVNDPPTISPISDVVMNEDGDVTINITIGDLETAAGSLTYAGTRTNTTLFPTIGTSSSHRLRLGGTGANRTLRIRPAANLSGESDVTLTVGDGSTTTSVTFKITVNPVYDPPVVRADNLLGVPGRTSTFDLLRNDSAGAEPGQTISLLSFTQPSSGTLVAGTVPGTVRYTPFDGYTGADQFTYTVIDNTGVTVVGIGYVTVAPQMSIDQAHTDIRANYVGGEWTTDVHADLDFGSPNAGGAGNSTILDFDEAVLIANPASLLTLPANLDASAYSFLGRAPGEQIYILPQSQDPAVLWPGVSTESITSGTFATYTPVGDPRATANGEWVQFELVGYRIPTNAVFSMFYSDATPTVHWDSIDGINAANEGTQGGNVSDTFWITRGSHAHMNWTFTHSGRYELDVRIRAKIDQGGTLVDVVSPVNTIVFSVDEASPGTNTETPPQARPDTTQTVEDGTGVQISVLSNDSNSPDRLEQLVVSSVTQPANGVVTIAGDGQSVTYVPTANFSGNDSFTYTITDEHGGQATATVQVTVTDVNDAPTISSITDPSIIENTSTGALSFQVGDLETAANDLVVTATSSNTELVPSGNIVIGGTAANRTVTITPAPHQLGVTTITLTVTDSAGEIATSVFLLTVVENNAPTISDISNLFVAETTSSGPIAFTVGDVETAADDLVVTVASSNTTVVPNANIVLGGSGANRTLTVTPAANQVGPTTITVTVTDGNGAQTSDTFVLTVVANRAVPFSLPTFVDAGAMTNSFSSVSGDFTGDGKADLIVAGTDYDQLTFLQGTGTGSFVAGTVLNAGQGADVTALAEIDAEGDGDLDLFAYELNAATNEGTADEGVIALYRNDGTGQFTRSVVQTGLMPGYTLAVGDLNGDGRADVAYGSYRYNSVTQTYTAAQFFALQQADGQFGASTTLTTDMPDGAVLFGDVNGDGKQDIVTSGGYSKIISTSPLVIENPKELKVFLGNGDGTVAAPQLVASGNFPEVQGIVDMNGDGRKDLLVYDRLTGVTGHLRYYPQQADGSFGAGVQPLPNHQFAQATRVVDLNGDTIPDVVSYSYTSSTYRVSWARGLGGGAYAAPVVITPTPGGAGLHVLDADGDSHLDVITVGPVSTTIPEVVVVHLNQTGEDPMVLIPPAARTRVAGDPIDLSVYFGFPITVSGTPRIALDVGGNTVYANYLSGSGTATLTFRYTATSADLDLDGVQLASNVIQLNGGTLTDPVGGAGMLTFPNLPFTGVIVNGRGPLVQSITRLDPGTTTAGTVRFNVTFAESVTGVDVADFAVRMNAGDLAGAAVQSVAGSGSVYEVTVSTGTGTGTLGLSVSDGASIFDLNGDVLAKGYPGGEVYTVRPTPVGTIDTYYTNGHADYRPIYTNGEFTYILNPDNSLLPENEYPSDEVITYLDSTAIVNRPTGTNYDFIGVGDGQPFYLSNSSGNIPSVPFLGWSGESLVANDFADYRPTDPRITSSTLREYVKVQMVGFRSSSGGHFSLYSGSTPTIWFATSDGIGSTDNIWLYRTHFHRNTAFSKPGTYEIDVVISGYLDLNANNALDATDVYVESGIKTMVFHVDTLGAVADSFVVVTGNTLNGNVSVNDDWHESMGAYTPSVETGPTNGTLTLNPDGTFSYTPTSGYVGTDSFTYRLTNERGGVTTATATATITVNALPTISDVAKQFTLQNTPTVAIPFTVGDAETAAADLVVTATSSNTTVVPNANIVLGGSGANRTLTVTPAANQVGPTTITVTVTDGHGAQTSDTFVLTVTANSLVPFAVPTSFSVSSENASSSLASADFNGDGKIDVVSVGSLQGSLVLLKGNGDGTFQAGVPVDGGSPYFARTPFAADYDGDGDVDLLTREFDAPPAGIETEGQVAVHLNDGAGNFTRQVLVGGLTLGASAIQVGELNGDGRPDFIRWANSTTLVYHESLPGGGYAPPEVVSSSFTSLSTTVFRLNDIDADGDLDILAYDTTPRTLSFFRNDGAGNFGAPQQLTFAATTTFRAIADITGDGRPDVITTDSTTVYYPQNSDGTFGARTVLSSIGSGVTRVVPSDLNQDGVVDLIITQSNALRWVAGRGNGTFGATQVLWASAGVQAVIAPDLDGDGDEDIVVGTSTANTAVTVLENLTGENPMRLIPPAARTYFGGDQINLQVHFGFPITVTGTPRLALQLGSNTVYADYVSGSGTPTLTFRYTVGATDVDLDGMQLTSNTVDLNGGALTDPEGAPAVLAFPGSLTGVIVNAPGPLVQMVSRLDSAATSAGTVRFAVQFAEDVTGVDVTDFAPRMTEGDLTGAVVQSVTGSGSLYEVTVSTGTGSGTLGLTVLGSASILDLNGDAFSLEYAGGQVYTVRPQPVGTIDTYYTNGHADYRPVYNNGDFDTVWHGNPGVLPQNEYSSNELITYLDSTALVTRPAGANFDFLGVNEGDPLYLSNASGSVASVPFMGISGESLTSNVFADYLPTDPRIVSGTLREYVKVQLVGMRSSSAGEFSLYSVSSGTPTVWMATNDGIAGTDNIWTYPGTHAHYNTAFSKPGTYEIDVVISGYLDLNANNQLDAADVYVESGIKTMVFHVDTLGAVADSYTVYDRGELQGSVTANDTWHEALGGMTASVVTTTTKGTLTLQPDGSFTYVPSESFDGSDSFVYQLTNARGGVTTATATIMGQSLRDFQVRPGARLYGNVLPADSLAAGGLATELVTAPTHGTIALNPNGSFVYTPASAFSGSDMFTFLVRDAEGAESAASVTISAQPPDAQTAVLATVHADIEVAFGEHDHHDDGGVGPLDAEDHEELELHVHDETNDVEHEPEDVVLFVGPSALLERPVSSAFDFIGVAPNETYYRLPESVDPTLLFLGVGGAFEDGVFQGDTVSLRLVSLIGPGHFAVWVNGDSGPQVLFSTADGITDGDRLSVLAEGHGHYNWSFTAPGRYSVILEAVGTLMDGDVVSSGPVTYTFSVDEQPTGIEASADSLAEELANGTLVAELGTSDPLPGSDHEYELVSGPGDTHNPLFRVVGNRLETNGRIDFETLTGVSVRVRSTNPAGQSIEQVLTLNVSDVNERPTLANVEVSVAESIAPTATITTLSAIDPDASQSLVYEIVGGNSSGLFRINSVTGRIQLAEGRSLDFEAASQHVLTVRVTDSATPALSTNASVTINVTDDNEVPTEIRMTSATLAENLPSGHLIGRLSAVDPDAGDQHLFTLVTGTGDADNARFRIEGDRLLSNESFNYEQKKLFSIRVRATDADGLFVESIVTIGVDDIVEAFRFFRAYNSTVNSHFFTTSDAEFQNAVANGYVDESTSQNGFAIFEFNTDGTIPLYRLYNLHSGQHYYTTNAVERDFLVNLVPMPASGPDTRQFGWRYEGIAGAVSPTPQTGMVEIFRLYNVDTGVHLFTESAAVRDAVLAIEEMVDGQPTGRRPWQLHSSLGFSFAVTVTPTSASTQGTPPSSMASATQSPVVAAAVIAEGATITGVDRLISVVSDRLQTGTATSQGSADDDNESSSRLRNWSSSPGFGADELSEVPVDLAFVDWELLASQL